MESAQYSKLFNYLWNIGNDMLEAIVSFIEEKAAKIDQAVEGLTQQVAALKEYKQRLIADVVTGQMRVA